MSAEFIDNFRRKWERHGQYVLVFVPPRYTPVLQPLDVGGFGILKPRIKSLLRQAVTGKYEHNPGSLFDTMLVRELFFEAVHSAVGEQIGRRHCWQGHCWEKIFGEGGLKRENAPSADPFPAGVNKRWEGWNAAPDFRAAPDPNEDEGDLVSGSDTDYSSGEE
jgi:hypothetical protein